MAAVARAAAGPQQRHLSSYRDRAKGNSDGAAVEIGVYLCEREQLALS
ncbi:MAG: hypothetical protein ABR567_10700 [Myxococcales bacterium]